MPDIQAQSADGTVHVFPDGTPDAVVDRVMKQYAQSGQTTAQTNAMARGAGESQRSTMPVLPKMQKDSDKAYGFTPTNMMYQAGEGVRELGSSAYEMGKDILFPQGNSESERLMYLLKKYALDPADAERQKAEQSTSLSEKAGHYAASVLPVAGPYAASLGEQAGSGDVGGAVAKAGAQYAALKATKPVINAAKTGAGMAREAVGNAIHTPEGDLTSGAKIVGQVAGGVAGTAAGTVVGHPYIGAGAGYRLGPSLLEKMFPEAKSAVDARAAYEQAKTITEAQEAAISQNTKIDSATAKQAAAAAKAAQKAIDDAVAAREKHAQDLMDRQAQQDKLDAAAAKASNAAARAKRQMEQDHADAIKEIETTRQKDLAAAEKLRDQHAQSLMDRQKQQDALDKQAAQAEKAAKASRDQQAQDLMDRQNQQDALDRKAVQAAREAWRYRPTANTTKSNGVPISDMKRAEVAPESSELSGQDLISRVRKIVIPGDQPSAADLKRAGDFTQVSTTKLKELAKFGDELAKSELRRRQKQ